jgi:hypothetical protein
MAEPDRTEAARTHGNTGHGHVWPRPDGMRARCGGPGLCAECSRDKALRDKQGEMPVTPAPEPTNDAVSDERLREIIDGCDGVTPGSSSWKWLDLGELVFCGEGDAEVGVIECMDERLGEHIARLDPATVKALATELLARRSVTSQASEGEVVAWQGDAPDGRRGLTSNSKVAEMWKDVGRTVTPLYASPSKRVERLEAALREITKHSFVKLEKEPGRTLDETVASLLYQEWHAVLEIARQAPQGGRS